MDPNLKLDDWAGRTIDIIVDRPLGGPHPKDPDLIYELNCGYIPGTIAPDGHPIDVYILGVNEPLEKCSAKVIGVIRCMDDIEDKIVVAISGEWDKQSILEATAFQEQYFDTWVELPS